MSFVAYDICPLAQRGSVRIVDKSVRQVVMAAAPIRSVWQIHFRLMQGRYAGSSYM